VAGTPSGSPSLVVLPTYNERENLERAVSGIRAYGHDVLIVDDASPDGTGALADELATSGPGILVLHRPGKLGLGTAYLAGFRVGLERGYRFLFEMDADGSHDPKDLDRLLVAARTSQGLAIGSRYVRGGATEDWPLERQLLSKAANLYCRAILGFAVHDWTSGFRCYSAEVLRSIGLDEIFSDGYCFQVEMAFRCLRRRFRVLELPILFRDRVAGESKVCSMELREAFWCVLHLRVASLARTERWRPVVTPTGAASMAFAPEAEVLPPAVVG
jgi:dolichol-phosphate mannosyltransferase